MCVFLIFLCLQTPTYNEGIKVLNEQGVEAAIKYFKSGIQATGDPNLVFGLGWVFWESGELKRAEDTCRFLLSKNPPDKIKARTHYLLSFIVVERDASAGVGHLKKALGLYQKNDEKGNVFKAFMGLAYVYFKLGKIDETEVYLEKANRLNESEGLGKNLGWFFSMRSRLAFVEKDINSALRYAQLAEAEYRKVNVLDKILSANLSQAFFSLLLGKYEDAYDMMIRADKVILANEHTQLHVYNAVNWILYYNCHGEKREDLLKYVQDYLAQNDDNILREQLITVQKHCSD